MSEDQPVTYQAEYLIFPPGMPTAEQKKFMEMIRRRKMSDMLSNTHHISNAVYVATYWKENTACNMDDEWTRVTIVPRGSWTGYPSWDFAPDEDYEMQKVIRGLQIAFASGEESAKNKIKQVLGIGK